MTTFRIEDGVYVPYSAAVIDDAEEQLEQDLENNPHVILAPEKLLYIGRQTQTPDGRALDLLAVTSDRRPVIIELKKNRTPRDMMAQALEYAAFIDSSSNDDIDRRAVDYFDRAGRPWKSLREAHEAFFEGSAIPEPERAWELADAPIIVLEGQQIAPQIMDVAFYLRKHDIDVRVVQLSYQIGPAEERLVTVLPLLQPRDDRRLPATESLDEQIRSAPAGPVFLALCDGLSAMGLVCRALPTGVSFMLPPRAGTIASVWLSARRGAPGTRVYLQVYAQYVPGGLDAFDAEVSRLGFERERGTNMSVHLNARDQDRVPDLIEAFRVFCLDPALQGNATP